MRHLLLGLSVLVVLGGPGYALEASFQEGLSLLNAGQYLRASERIQQSLLQEASAPKFFALGVCHYKLRDYKGAMSAYQEALKYLPDRELRAKIYSAQADIYYQLEVPEQALLLYRKVLRDYPGWLGVRLRLAQSYLQIQDYTKLESELRILKQLAPSHSSVLELDSHLSVFQEDFETAQTRLEALVERGEFELAPQLLQLYRMNGKHYEAVVLTRLWEHSYPGIPMVQMHLGDSLWGYELRRCLSCDSYISEIEQPYLAFTLLQPESAPGYLKLGKLYFYRHRYSKARFFFSKAWSLYPRGETLFYLLQTQKILGQAEAVSEELSDLPEWRAMQLIDLPGSFEKGYALWQKQAFVEARAHWKKLDPKSLEYDMVRALWMIQSGEVKWAQKALLQVRDREPEWYLSYHWLAILAHKEGDERAAHYWHHQSLRWNPFVLEDWLAWSAGLTEQLTDEELRLLESGLVLFSGNRVVQDVYLNYLEQKSGS